MQVLPNKEQISLLKILTKKIYFGFYAEKKSFDCFRNFNKKGIGKAIH